MHTSITDFCWTRDLLALADKARLCGLRLDSLEDLVERADRYENLSQQEELTRVQELLLEASEVLWLYLSGALGKQWPAAIIGLPDEGGEEARMAAKSDIRNVLAVALDLLVRANTNRQLLSEDGATYRHKDNVERALGEAFSLLGLV